MVLVYVISYSSSPPCVDIKLTAVDGWRSYCLTRVGIG